MGMSWLESDARYGVGKFEGGSYFWKGRSRKGGGDSEEPPEPTLPGYRPAMSSTTRHQAIVIKCWHSSTRHHHHRASKRMGWPSHKRYPAVSEQCRAVSGGNQRHTILEIACFGVLRVQRDAIFNKQHYIGHVKMGLIQKLCALTA